MDAFSAVMGDRRGVARVRFASTADPHWWRLGEAESREGSFSPRGSFGRIVAWLDAAYRDGFTRLHLQAIDYGAEVGSTWALEVLRLGGGAFTIGDPRERRLLEPTHDEVSWLEWYWPEALRTLTEEDGTILGYLTSERDARN